LRLAVTAAAVLAIGLATAAHASPAAPTDADCMACHEDPSLEAEGGRKVGVSAPAMAASVHGQAGLACVDCHAALAAVSDFPHAEDLAKVDCSGCHPDASAQHDAGVHGQAAQKSPGSTAAACTDCHGGPHEIRSPKDALSPAYHFNLPATCGRCHGGADGVRATELGAGEAPAAFHDSIHGRALTGSGLIVAPNCATCHGHHEIRAKGDEQSRVFRANVPATCGACHAGIRSRYDEGVHGAAIRSGNLAAAVCSDCHQAHGIEAADLPSWRLDVIRECGTCHEESFRTYRDGFHGQASALGFTRVAVCADCHGAHDIHPRQDPRSQVAPARLVSTCGQCHPYANENFVQYDPHAEPDDPERSAPVYYTDRFMKILLGGVFAFFGVHTALWFPREIVARRRHGRPVPVGGAPPPSGSGPAAPTGPAERGGGAGPGGGGRHGD